MPILVADDNPAIVHLLSIMLTAWGYTAVITTDARGVLEYLQANTPDLLLIKGALPNLSGFEACSRIRRLRRLRSMPVVLLLEAHDEAGRVQARLVGANGILHKPLSGEALRAMLARLELAPTAHS